ncbi:MAG: hypothetical protein J6U00_10470 [Ruminococcus sp.]|uniref:hypothetical protein n=1 Tax=Ruminococcus sp. TaxID=41978 RepID=UPI001AFD54BC|nr:hypothetical protein [Ruminococcus sp.]MBO7474400.1 hypothetical protein [Ruminococcus sp.]
MIKLIKLLSFFAVIIIISLTALRFIAPSVFFNYIYPFSRIKGNVSITIDDRNIKLSDCEFSCTHNGKKEKINVSGSHIKIRAGKYGRYCCTLKHDETEIRFYIYQYNCWDCTDFDISFNADIKKQTISCTGWSRSLNENGLKSDKHIIDTTQDLNNQEQYGMNILN